MTPRRRRRAVRLATPVVAVAVPVGLTVGLARTTAGATFTTTTKDTGNVVSSAPSFCTASAPQTVLTAVGDTWVDESSTGANHQNDTSLYVRSSSAGNYRTWIRFTLPAVPHDCVMNAATLKVYDATPTAGRTIDVYAGDPTAPTWSSSTITWANQPGVVGGANGSATTGTAGWQVWGVTSDVRAQYANGNNGFVLRDRNEGASTAATQAYDDLDGQGGSLAAQLVLDWA